jgi:nucleoside-diphosphate-sugar epimerase
MMSSFGLRKVLITGAAGRVGQALSVALAATYDLTLLDIRPFPNPRPPAPFIQADSFDIEVMRQALQGVDTVLPLAISGNMHSSWDTLAYGNLTGVLAVFQAASECGVRRVVFPSSVLTDLTPGLPYAAAKLWAEQIAERYAALTPLSILCLRLGRVCHPNEPNVLPGSLHLEYAISHRDMAHLFTCAIEAPDTLKYGVLRGFSDNHPPMLDISETRRVLGYAPQDDMIALAHQAALNPRSILRRLKRWAIKKLVSSGEK